MLALALLAPGRSQAAPPPVEVAGAPRFFAGEAAKRRLSGVPTPPTNLTWHVLVHGAEVARGGAEPGGAPGTTTLALRMPAVTRRVRADLLVIVDGRRATEVPVEIVPDPSDEVVAAAGDDRIGWLGPLDSVPPRLVRTGLGIEALEGPDALARFRGRLLVVAAGAWDVRRVLAPLLARVRDGARALAFGPDDAPWVDPHGTPHDETVDAALVEGWGPASLAAWGGGGARRRGALRPPAGNHTDLVADVVREAYVGRGTMTLVCLPVLEHVEDDPLAVTVLARLVDRARRDPPRLAAPRAVHDPTHGRVASLFGAARGDGPVVARETEGVTPDDAAPATGRLFVGPRRSVASSRKGRRDGPGLDDEPGFLRFATEMGVRVEAELPWRSP